MAIAGEFGWLLSGWHCIHLISGCVLPIAYFSAPTSLTRVRIIKRKLGIETLNRVVFYNMRVTGRETLYTVLFVSYCLVFAFYIASLSVRSVSHIIVSQPSKQFCYLHR